MLLVVDQAVIVDDQTRYKDTAFGDIVEENVLEVSGWLEPGDRIRATYVRKIAEKLDPATELLVKGLVAETNLAQHWFRINELTVYISGLADPLPSVGQLVVVHGTLDDNGMLMATALAIEDELGLDEADSVEIDGIVSKVSSATDFILGTTPVQTDEITIFKGLEPDEIIPGARLLVKGSLANRQLLADEIIAKDKVHIEGDVSQIIGNQIELESLAGLLIHVSLMSKIFGAASDLNELQVGQHIKVLGYAVEDDKIAATQIKVEKRASDRVKLQGPVTAISGFLITVFSVDIDVSRITEFEIDDKGEVSRDQFLNAVTTGDTVNANGNLINDVIEWKGVELDQE